MLSIAALLDYNSLVLHYGYFIFVAVIGSVILYFTSAQISDLHYADASFMGFSAVTGTGLNVVDLSLLTTVQQATLLALFILGHAIPLLGVSSSIRAWVFYNTLKDESCKKEELERRLGISSLEVKISELLDEKDGTKTATPLEIKSTVVESSITSTLDGEAGKCTIITDLTNPNQIQQMVIVDEKRTTHPRKRIFSRLLAQSRKTIQWTRNHLTPRLTTNLTGSDCVECRALLFLSLLIFFYFFLFLSLGILILGLCLELYHPDIPRADGISPLWAAAFLATSSFVNNGMSLIDASMAPFQRNATPLLVCGFLILAGNTLFPCLLRLSIWGMRKLSPSKTSWQAWRQTLDFTLAESQNICSSLYPTWHTWFLLGTILVLNSIMWGAFELAVIQDTEIKALPAGYRVLDGLFQSLCYHRVCSFYMYLSAFPVSAAIRYDNLTSLCSIILTLNRSTEFVTKLQISDIISKDDSTKPSNTNNHYISRLARGRFIYQQIRSQFSHDIWWLSLTIIVITIAESDHFKSEPIPFSTFNIIFEVVSAYSCVGASIGYPGKTYSFCGKWHTFSKLLLVAISLKGRLRGVSIASARSTSFYESWKKSRDVEVQKDYDLEFNAK
ncbi:hypothetical protein N7493_000584 [Penicillium malachiteum]|uniref:Cation transporter n=1 Tax=Penicillium malachiteum TaxID=1324776 RepID=A0AAD6N144_9EURO|nr:hypothetical protein N7493_000584 [Penicillium malachiteum]